VRNQRCEDPRSRDVAEEFHYRRVVHERVLLLVVAVSAALWRTL
jgi:hypothetical protein